MPSHNPVIIFDGQCLLCSAWVAFVVKHDRQAQFRFASAQSTFGRATYQRHALDPDAMTTMILLDGDCALTESDAALAILRKLGWPWRLVSAFCLIPRFIRDGLYRFVARNRYRWFGTRCWIPSAELAERIL